MRDPRTTLADPELMTVEEVAEMLTVPVRTVRFWRQQRSGPRSVKVGRHVRFRKADVLVWLDESQSA